jgi:hypothetical protein
MKPIMIVGILLVLVGIGGLATGGFSFTTKEKVIDLGPIDVTADKKHSVPFPELASGAAILAGIVLIVMGAKKTA